MDLGFINSPLAYINYSPPSTRSKDRDELNVSYALNRSYHTPIRKNVALVKESNSFLSFLFGTEQSQNKTAQETVLESCTIWNTERSLPTSHEDLKVCSSEDEFSPCSTSSPDLDSLKTVKAIHNKKISNGELKVFSLNSNIPNSKNSNSDDLTIPDKDSLKFFNQVFYDDYSRNSENNSSVDSNIFENDSLKLFKEESPKHLQPFHEKLAISRQLFVSENILPCPVSRKQGLLKKGIDGVRSGTAELSETSWSLSPDVWNKDIWMFRKTNEYNQVPCQVDADESNDSSNSQEFIETTKSLVAKEDPINTVPFSLNNLHNIQFLERNISDCGTPQRRCSTSNFKSKDTFQTPTQKIRARDGHYSKIDVRCDMVSLSNKTGIFGSFESENGKMDLSHDRDFILFGNNKYQHQRDEIADTFCKDLCDSTLDNKGICFLPTDISNVVPQNVCDIKYQNNLRDPWNPDCDMLAYDNTIAIADISENLNLEYDSRFRGKINTFHTVSSTNLISEKEFEVEFQSHLSNFEKNDCNLPVSDMTITASNLVKNLKMRKCLPSLCANRQIITYETIGQSSGQMSPIQNIKVSKSKILPQISVDQFLKEELLLRNDFSVHIFSEMADQILSTTESYRTNGASLQVVSYRYNTLQASTDSTIEFSSNFECIRKRNGFDYLELFDENPDLIFEKNDWWYTFNERNAKYAVKSAKKCLTFPSMSTHHTKEDELSVYKKQNNCNDAFLKSEIDEKQEDSSDDDSDDFVSASEFSCSSSEIFYDMEEFCDTSVSGSSEKNWNVDNSRVVNPFSETFYDMEEFLDSSASGSNEKNCCADNSVVAAPFSETFYDREEFCDSYLLGSIEKENCCADNSVVAAPFSETFYDREELSDSSLLGSSEKENCCAGNSVVAAPFSETFYDREEFCDTSVSGSSKRVNFCAENSKNCVFATSFSDIKNKSPLQNGRTNLCRSKISSAIPQNNLTSDLFNQNEPVIVKYLNERTQQIEEMLIYPIEYHENMSRKIGRKSVSQAELIEKLIEKSKVYVGKPVGIVLNVKDIRKDRKPVSEERDSLTGILKEKTSKEANILAIKEIDSCNANALSVFVSEKNINCDKQKFPSLQCRHDRSVDSYECTVSCPRKLPQNQIDIYENNVKTEQNSINKYNLATYKRPIISRSDSCISLKENTNVYLNNQKTVVSSNCKNKSQKRYCIPLRFQKVDSISSKPNINRQENKYKRWLHVRKQPFKTALISCSTVNTIEPSTFLVSSTSQQEVRIIKKSPNANLFPKNIIKPSLFEPKENLMRESSGRHSSSLSIQKYNSFSNRYFNDSQEKWLQKMDISSRKRVNIDEIISSDFKMYFNAYAKRGGRLKSGSVISKSNSNYWLKKAGVICDERSLKIAEKSFVEIARKKLVLNICDYMHYLILLSKRTKTCLADLVQQLKTLDASAPADSKKRMNSTISLTTNLSGDSNFKSHGTELKKSCFQVPERFLNGPMSSTPK